MANEAHKFKLTKLIIASGETDSETMSLEPWTTFVGVRFPAMDDGSCFIHVALDGTNFDPIIDPADGADYIVAASGSDPCFADISDYIRAVPRGYTLGLIKFVCAAQTPAITLTIVEQS